MMEDDEIKLMQQLQEADRLGRPQPYIRDIVREIGMTEERAAKILEEWAENDWLEYGVSPFAGWLTEKGLDVDVWWDEGDSIEATYY